MQALHESTCNVQLVQELTHEATLNFSLHETMSAMMTHSGDAVQSTGKTALQDKAAAILGTLLLASDVIGAVCGRAHGGRSAHGAFGFRQTTSRFQLGGGTRNTFPTSVRESRESFGRRVRILLSGHLATAHIRFDFLLGAGAAAQVEILGCDVSKNTFTIFTQVRQ